MFLSKIRCLLTIIGYNISKLINLIFNTPRYLDITGFPSEFGVNAINTLESTVQEEAKCERWTPTTTHNKQIENVVFSDSVYPGM